MIFNLALSLQTLFLLNNNCPAYCLSQASLDVFLKDVCFLIYSLTRAVYLNLLPEQTTEQFLRSL